MRVCIVEDDTRIAAFLQKGLEQERWVVDAAGDGVAGLTMCAATSYDAIVLDVMLPRLDGLSVLRRLRERGVTTPVLILSARASVDDRVRGLKDGGDDYLVKPFAFSELVARLEALTRRAQPGTSPAADTLAYGDLRFELATRQAFRGTTRLELTPKEALLLELFLRQPERVLSKTTLLERIWNLSFDPQTNVVDVLVCRLRARVDKGYDPKLIHTVHGAGYVLRTG